MRRTGKALGVLLALGAAAWGAEPWDAPFARDAAAVWSAASAVKPADSPDVMVLLDEQRFTLDASGRVTAVVRKVYRVITPDAVDEWSSVEQQYAPWHQQKPQLRARVITPDSREHWLDEKTIADSPAEEFEANVFSDTRVLRAPLPSVLPGSVVEYEFTIRDTAPELDAGVARRITLVDTIPNQRFHVVLDAPPGVALRTKALLIPAEAIHRTESKRGTHIECDFGPVPVHQDFEFATPSDTAANPVFEFSTGASWQQIAARYEAIVNRQIAGADLGALAGPPSRDNVRVTAARLAAAVHQRVRYTGVEFGQAAIVPQAPAEVLRRGYGDCKDKAALLVALLRAAGLQANVALLLSGNGLDVDPELPGFGLFDHAIVHVDASPPLWIDATSPQTRIGDLPLGDQGRLALITSSSASALVRTPESQSADNRVVHQVEVRLSDYGRSAVHETVEGYGAFDAQLRSVYGNTARLRENLEREVKQVYAAESLGTYSVTPKDDFSRPFQLQVEARNSRLAVTGQDDAAVIVQPALVLQNLPFPFLAEGESKKVARTADFIFSEPYQAEFRYKVIAPRFFHPQSLPSAEAVKLGTATFSRDFQTAEDGSVEAIFRFDSGKRRLTPAEFETLREELKHVSTNPEVIGFVSATSEALALGKTREAVQLATDSVTQKPDSAGARARLTYVLIALGAGNAARASAHEAVDLDPKSGAAWQALAFAYTHDSFGRQYRGNWDFAEAEKDYRKAIEIDTDDAMAYFNLAVLLEHNADGAWHDKGARLAEAEALYREALKKQPNPAFQSNLMIDLVYDRKLNEAEAEWKKAPLSELSQTVRQVLNALKNGSARTIIDAQSDLPDPNSRAHVFGNAASFLSTMRRYDLATDLLQAAERISNRPNGEMRASLVAKVKPYEQFLQSTGDPRYPVLRLLVAAVESHPDPAAVRALFAARSNADADNVLRALRRDWRGIRTRVAGVAVATETAIDSIVSAVDLVSEGEDSFGYRIWAKSGPGVLPAFFVVKEDGQYRILGATTWPQNIGRLVLDLLQAHDLKSAQRWLDWLVSNPSTTDGSISVIKVNSTGTGGPLIRFLWSGVGEQGRSASVARVAAASLIGQYTASESAIRILQDARKTAANNLDRGQIDVALCEAFRQAGRWNDVLTTAKGLASNFPVADRSFEFVVAARTALKQWKELEQDALAQLKTRPGDAKALNAAATAAIGAGDRAKSTEYLERLASQPFAGKEEHLLNAWHALLVGQASESIRDALARDRSPYLEDPSVDYVLGLVQAATGKVEDATRSLSSALDSDDFTRLDPRPFVLLAKIEEQCGLPDAAQADYAKARTAPRIDQTSDWALALIPAAPAQNR